MKLFFVFLVFSVNIITSTKYKTFLSPAIPLKSGQIANTDKGFGPLDWPEGPIAISNFRSDVVDAKGISVPESELYIHHWLVYNGDNKQDWGFCSNLDAIFGIGAELRGVVYEYPPPYAIVTTGMEQWTANLHFIRTTNVKEVQECIECRCPDSNPPLHPHGEVGCCPDRQQCWGMENSTFDDSKDYFLKYTIGYEPITDNIIPLSIFYLDVTAEHTTDCRIQYDVPEVAEGQIHTKKSIVSVPSDLNVTYVEIHQHIGALNMSADHYRNGEFIGTLCSATAVYKDSYLVDIPTCIYPEPYRVLQGDELRLTSLYTGRTLPGGHAWHSGVMGLVYLAASAAPLPKMICMDRLHELCGSPPYKTQASCVTCAGLHTKDLISHNCTEAMVGNECAKTTAGGNIPAPDEVNMTLSFNAAADDKWLVSVTAPSGAWFGIGESYTNGTMKNAFSWVYMNNDVGKPVLQSRILGNHDSGSIVNADLPCNVSNIDKTTYLTFFLDQAHSNFADFYWLFAQGEPGKMDFSYHGSTRGATKQSGF